MMKPMKSIITICTALFCIYAGVINLAYGQSCPDSSVQVRNVKLFNKCYCKTNRYEELTPILRRYGLKLEIRGDGTGWSEKVKDKDWYYCSINLKWEDNSKRSNSEFCGDENRKKIIEEVKEALNHPVIINSPFLTCR